MRLIGYVRASTGGQQITLEAQEAKIRAMATVKGFPLVDVIVDAGESAKDLERPGMRKILAMVEARQIDGLIICKLDRVTRSVKDLGALMDQFAKRDVSLISVEEQLDTGSASGRLVLNIMVSVSQWEREIIGERTATALQFIKSTGCPAGPAPYGFRSQARPVVAGKRVRMPLLEDEYEQAAIKAIFDLHERGLSYSQIALQLNEAGYTTRKQGLWFKPYVGRVLRDCKPQEPVIGGVNVVFKTIKRSRRPVHHLSGLPQ